jgi:transposase
MLISNDGAGSGFNGKRRRRLWSEEEKRRIVAEATEPGASVSVVARRHDVNANMVFTWRRELGVGVSDSADARTTFVPAVIVGADVDAAALARVLEVLARR